MGCTTLGCNRVVVVCREVTVGVFIVVGTDSGGTGDEDGVDVVWYVWGGESVGF